MQPEETNDKLIFLEGHTDKIKKTMEKVASDFIYIGFLLWEVKCYKYYLSKGYKDIIEYGQQELGFKKSSTYNFIRIAEEFSEPTSFGQPSMFISKKYKNCSYSKLTEMLSLGEKDREAAKDMNVREIRELKKDSRRLENNVSVHDNQELKGQLKFENDSVVEVDFEVIKNDVNVNVEPIVTKDNVNVAIKANDNQEKALPAKQSKKETSKTIDNAVACIYKAIEEIQALDPGELHESGSSYTKQKVIIDLFNLRHSLLVLRPLTKMEGDPYPEVTLE